MTETRNCPRCGVLIGETASPGGLCPACLMKMGFDSRSGVVVTGPEAAPRPPPPAVEDLRAHFPQLEILEHIGQGGMGAVYKARQRSLERDVALKVLTIDTSADPSFGERFEREAKTLASLSHPGIVSVIDSGRAGPWFYFVMEFVDGASLRQMLRAGEVAPREALSIVGQICDALQYAHDHGVVHRDIKPENVLVTRKGQVKILDFGLAKLVGDKVSRESLTGAQQVMGTPHYMAPEQWEKPQTVDHRADIYALGVVFYELLTGELPLGRFPLPSQKVRIDVRLDDVVVKTLEKEPERRYQHASEVKSDVEGIAATPAGDPRDPEHSVRSPSSRRWLLWGSIGCAALLLAPLVFALVLFSSHQAPPSSIGAVPVRRENEPRTGDSATIASVQAEPSPLNRPSEEHDRLGDFAHDPALQSVFVQSLGFDPERLVELNAALQNSWRDYLALEARHSRGSWSDSRTLSVDIDGFSGEVDRTLSELERSLAPFVTDPGSRGVREVGSSMRDRMKWGSAPEWIQITQFDSNWSIVWKPWSGRDAIVQGQPRL